MTNNLPYQCRKDPKKEFLTTLHCDILRGKTEEQMKEEKNYRYEYLDCPGCEGPVETGNNHIVPANKKVIKDKKPLHEFQCDNCEKPLKTHPSTGLCRDCYLERAKQKRKDKLLQGEKRMTEEKQSKGVCCWCKKDVFETDLQNLNHHKCTEERRNKIEQLISENVAYRGFIKYLVELLPEEKQKIFRIGFKLGNLFCDI